MNEEDRPVTRSELRQELANFKAEIKGELDGLRGDMKHMHEDLSHELAGHVRAAAEENRRLIIGLDDRYRDLPGRVTALERELDEHRRDSTLHPGRRRRR